MEPEPHASPWHQTLALVEDLYAKTRDRRLLHRIAALEVLAATQAPSPER